MRVKFTSVDVLTLCFGENLPAAGNTINLYIQRAMTVYEMNKVFPLRFRG